MGRGLKLLIALAVLAGLLVAGDVAARKYAEHEAAARLRSSQQIDGEAQVHIHGFPFLTQALRRKLDDVEVTGADVGRGQLRLTHLHATLRGVRPSSNASSATVESVDGTALVSYQDLNNAVNRSDVTVSDGGQGLVKV